MESNLDVHVKTLYSRSLSIKVKLLEKSNQFTGTFFPDTKNRNFINQFFKRLILNIRFPSKFMYNISRFNTCMHDYMP